MRAPELLAAAARLAGTDPIPPVGNWSATKDPKEVSQYGDVAPGLFDVADVFGGEKVEECADLLASEQPVDERP